LVPRLCLLAAAANPDVAGSTTAVAVIIFLIFYTVFSCVIRIVKRVMKNPKKPVDPVVQPFVTTLLKLTLWIQVIPIILGRISESIGTSVLTIIGNVTISIGLAMKPMVENFISGMVLAIMKPFEPGQIVSVGGVFGKVREVRALSTIIDEPDGDVIYVPNAKVFGGPMNNFSAAGRSRMDIGSFGLDHSTDLAKARAELIAACNNIEKVMQDPPPAMIVTEITPTSIVVSARVWVLPGDRYPVPFLVREAVFERYRSKGVPITSWQSGQVMASAIATLHETGFKNASGHLGKGGGGHGDDDDVGAVVATLNA
jgi:small conductance mechanosensitive channel